MKEIIGKKIGMTRLFKESGEVIPVTVIQAGPCPVVTRMVQARHGVAAYQVGFGERRRKLITKPAAGHFAKANVEPTHILRTIHFDENELEIGKDLRVDSFKEGEAVDVTGTSKGLGFQGVMRRHNFGGANKTHGQSDRWRAPGSVGSSSYPSRVFKGMRMAGKMGKDKKTVLNLRIVKIIPEQNLMLVDGPIPGKSGSLVKVRISVRGSSNR